MLVNHLKWPRTLRTCSVGVGRGCRHVALGGGWQSHWWGLHGRFTSCPAEVQLKPKHQPYKLGRQWPELLLRFTDAPDDDVATGQCATRASPLRLRGLQHRLAAQPGL